MGIFLGWAIIFCRATRPTKDGEIKVKTNEAIID
jgi:hypothetical protein